MKVKFNIKNNAVLFTILTILTISCTSKKNKRDIDHSAKDSLAVTFEIQQQDTLRNPIHPYYMYDVEPKEYGKLILSDSVKPFDNYSTFRVIDSLGVCNEKERKFYYDLFINIHKKADGALGEYLGVKSLEYVRKYTPEFFGFLLSTNKEDLDVLGCSVGIEIVLSSNDDIQENMTNLIKLLKAQSVNLSAKEIILLDSFIQELEKCVELNS